MQVRLLEREGATAAMGEALRASRAGSGRVVLVHGEAGVGKTALLDHFIASHPSVRWLRGYCEALSTPRSLGPVFDFEDVLPAPLRETLRAEADRRSDFYRGLLDALDSDAEPVVLVLEDLHWADGATLELVRFIGRRIRSHRALVILTARDDAHSWGALAPVIGEIPSVSLQRVKLQPLSLQGVRAIAAGRSWDPGALHEATGGNPFFVTEVLRGVGSGRQVPASVRDAVEARMRQLPPGARAFAQQVSIMPRHALVDDLRELQAFDVDAADECLTAGLLLLDGGAIRFRHELARAAVEDSMPPARRLAPHRQLLQVLATRPPGSVPLAHLSHHARQAGDVGEILRWAPAAAREAAARGARRDAAAHCEAALAHAGQLPAPEQAQLLETLGDSQFELNQLEQATASYRRAAGLLGSCGRLADQARCVAKQAMPLVRSLRNVEADATSAEALQLAQASGDKAALGFASGIESYLRMLNRDYRLAIEVGERAIRLAQETGDAALLASGYKTAGAALIFLDHAKGCELLERSLSVAHELQDGGFAAADAYLMLGTASGELYEFAAAERWIEEGIAFARSRDLDRQALYMEAWHAMCDMYAGRWDAAGERAPLVLAQDPQPSTTRIVALVTLGRLRARRGDPGASEVLDQALELASRSGTLQRLGPACVARAEAAWLRGDPPAVLREVARVWDLANAKGQRWLVGELAYWRALAGDPPAGQEGCAPVYVAELRGDWERASEMWLAIGCPYEAARALARGDEAAQVRALKLLDPLNALPLASRIRAAMRNAGMAVVPRGPAAFARSNAAGLTRREVQVLQMLARNLKNQEIAAQLSRSVRTVDHHVESLYAKLEVSARREAVDRARSMGLLDEK
jgi:DNA-binding CsgD family transcriptional regulator/tetratricopeptide (TPR) repeat protein